MTSLRGNGVVEFRFYRPGAQDVAVVANVPDWEGGRQAMTHEGNGWWVLCAAVPAGEFRFRYQADGEWFTDYAAHGVEFRKGTWQSLLNVGVPLIHIDAARPGLHASEGLRQNSVAA